MQNISLKKAETPNEFEGILSLQKENHIANLPQNPDTDFSFVYAQHDVTILTKMASKLPQIIATDKQEVIAYNLAMDFSMKDYLPSIIPMFEEFEKLNYNGKRLTEYKYIVGGQVCVATIYRGMGLIKLLYQQMQKLVESTYEICLTEISTRNHRSIHAHQKMGFEIIGTYHDGIDNWHIVLLDFNKHPINQI
jgi:GNAT superfamily N-acetyltransferase